MTPTRMIALRLLRGIVPWAGLFANHAAVAADPPPHWQQAGWGGGGYYWAAAWHPERDGVIYLGGDCAGMYKTEDHGNHWRIINRGLRNYAVYSIAVDPSNPDTVYAVTEDGVGKSTDGGEHWRILAGTEKDRLRITAERDRSIRALAVDPSDGNRLYAASPGGSIHRSTDGGQTWQVAWQPRATTVEPGVLRVQFGKLNGQYFGDLAVPVGLPAGLAAAACTGLGFTVKADGSVPKDSFLIAKTRDGVTYRSRNLAALYQNRDWQDIVLKSGDFILDPDAAKSPPAVATPVGGPDWAAVTRLDLACSGDLPAAATVLEIRCFGFVAGSGIVSARDFKTDQTLQAFGNIRLGAPPAGPLHSISVSAKNPAWVIAGGSESGLLLSRDHGRSWTGLAGPREAAGAAFDPTDPNILYGAFFKTGILKSTDAGSTWTDCSAGLAKGVSISEVVVSPANPQDLHAIGKIGWNGSYFHSHDGGKTWRESSDLTADPVGNPTLENLSAGTARLSAPTNIALNPGNPKELFLSANWRCPFSDDGGRTWSERDAGADISCITDIRFLNGKTYVTAMDEGTLLSETDGRTWRQLWPTAHTPGLSGHNWRVAVTEVNGVTRVVSTVSPWHGSPHAVVRSEDGGKSFSVTTAGLPAYPLHSNTMWESGSARALVVDPANPRLLYLGIDGDPAAGHAGGGIFRSTDGGGSWSQLPNQPASRRMFYGLAVDPTDSRRLFWGACGENGGVHRSTDGGATWQRVFRQESFIWNLHLTPDGTVYASGQQLYRSSDHGATWSQVTRFPGQPSLVGLEVDPRDPKVIWVALTRWDSAAGGGVFKSADGGATWQDLTGDLPCVKPQILRFNPATSELWAGHVGLYKIKQ